MALPTFFVIGAPKAGTTSLHHYLDQHTQVQMSAVKEPRFFAGDENGIPYPPDRVADLAQYEELFDLAVAVRGESSTDYATHPRRTGVPERIKAFVPDAKFIYVVRDPVARTISHYKMRVGLGESRPLAEALGDLSDLRSPYISPSLYASQLERYLRHFPQERILVVDQAELLSARRATLEQIFAFLAVDPTVDSAEFDRELLGGHEWRAYPPAYANFVTGFLGPRAKWIPPRARRFARRMLERRLWPTVDTSLEEGLRARLEERFAPDAGRLRELTGKPFSSWSL
jgi:sulfotransferase family protein